MNLSKRLSKKCILYSIIIFTVFKVEGYRQTKRHGNFFFREKCVLNFVTGAWMLIGFELSNPLIPSLPGYKHNKKDKPWLIKGIKISATNLRSLNYLIFFLNPIFLLYCEIYKKKLLQKGSYIHNIQVFSSAAREDPCTNFDQLSNFRLISLLPTFSKIFEKII